MGVWLKILVVLLALTLVAIGLTACTAPVSVDKISATVGSKGAFSIKLDDVTATAGAGVVASGSQVSLAHEEHTFKGLPASLIQVGPSVTLALNDGKKQPKGAITVRLKVDKNKVPKNVSGFAVATQRKGASTPELLLGRYNSKTGFVTVTTDHLSPFKLYGFDLGDFIKGIGDRLTNAWGVNFPSPECELSGATSIASYSMSVHAGVVPCVTVKNDKAQFVIHSVSSNPFRLTGTPDARGLEDTGVSAKSVVQVVLARALRLNKNVSTLLPGGTVAFDIDDSNPLKKVSFVQDPSVTLLGVLFEVADVSGILDKIKAVENTKDGLNALNCFGDLVKPLDRDFGSQVDTVVRGFLSCVGPFAGGVVWSLVTVAPGVLISLVLGLVNELTGNGEFTLSVKAIPLVQQVNPDDYLETLTVESGNGLDTVAFDSPSRNLQCGIATRYDAGQISCSVLRYSFSDSGIGHGRGNYCPTIRWKGLFGAGADHKMHGQCTDAHFLPNERTLDSSGQEISTSYPQNNILKVGQRVTFGDSTCNLTAPGGVEAVSCRNTRYGYSLTLSAKAVSYTNP